jgi:hypothetical protein
MVDSCTIVIVVASPLNFGLGLGWVFWKNPGFGLGFGKVEDTAFNNSKLKTVTLSTRSQSNLSVI